MNTIHQQHFRRRPLRRTMRGMNTADTLFSGQPQHFVLGDGVIGQAVADELRRQGLPCVLGSRHAPAAGAAEPHRHITVDALDAAALRHATRGATHLYLTIGLPYDSAVWARDWPRVMAHSIEAALAQGAVLVFFDNVYSYGPLPLAVPMREDHPRQPPSRKGAVRLGLLRQLHEAGQRDRLRWVVGRSADFYGPGVRNSVLYATAMARQLQGKRAQWLGNPDARHSFTYTGDAARALVQLAQDAGAWQQEWHLPTAGPAPTPRQLLGLSARLLGAPQGVQTLPPALFKLLQFFVTILREVDETLYQNKQDYVFDSSRFMARYPAFRVTPYETGIEAMVASMRDSARAAAPSTA